MNTITRHGREMRIPSKGAHQQRRYIIEELRHALNEIHDKDHYLDEPDYVDIAEALVILRAVRVNVSDKDRKEQEAFIQNERDQAVKEAMDQMREDIEAGDMTSIAVLLESVPKENLKAYLPEE